MKIEENEIHKEDVLVQEINYDNWRWNKFNKEKNRRKGSIEFVEYACITNNQIR